MKSRTLMALAVAGTFVCGSAFAGGMKHGSSLEVATPSSVNESAPWLANQSHSTGWTSRSTNTVIGMQDSEHGFAPIGASAGIGGSGFGGFDSTTLSASDSSFSGFDYSLSGPSGVEYWLWGDEIYGTGASSSSGGSGSGGFDSMSSFSDGSFDMLSGIPSDESFGAEQYLVWGPLSAIDSDDLALVEADADSYSPLTLSALSEGYTLLTPIYDELADASSFGDSSYQVSQYSPLSGEDDLAT
jgi:hypothetical protein